VVELNHLRPVEPLRAGGERLGACALSVREGRVLRDVSARGFGQLRRGRSGCQRGEDEGGNDPRGSPDRESSRLSVHGNGRHCTSRAPRAAARQFGRLSTNQAVMPSVTGAGHPQGRLVLTRIAATRQRAPHDVTGQGPRFATSSGHASWVVLLNRFEPALDDASTPEHVRAADTRLNAPSRRRWRRNRSRLPRSEGKPG
jgi:hypothetical protein